MSRAKAIGRRAITGGRATAIGAATGAGAFYLGRAIASRVDMVGQNWWAQPAIMAAGGHFLKQKPRFANVGLALVGAAGYAGALAYEMNKAAQPAETKGLQTPPFDVQGLQTPADPYALSDNSGTDDSPGTSAWAAQDAAIAAEDSVDVAMGL